MLRDVLLDIHRRSIHNVHGSVSWIRKNLTCVPKTGTAPSCKTALHHGEFCVETPEFQQDLISALQQACLIAMPYDTIIEGFRHWASTYQCSADRVLREALAATGTWLISFPSTWTAAQPTATGPDLSQEVKRAQVRFYRTSGEGPRRCPKEIVFLHFFSGHRREGDLQMQLEGLPIPDGCLLLVASIDVAIDETTCDLLQRKHQQKWIAFVKAGKACGLTIGPPCETWSIARYVEVPEAEQTSTDRLR